MEECKSPRVFADNIRRKYINIQNANIDEFTKMMNKFLENTNIEIEVMRTSHSMANCYMADIIYIQRIEPKSD